jgi:hypothetical protein
MAGIGGIVSGLLGGLGKAVTVADTAATEKESLKVLKSLIPGAELLTFKDGLSKSLEFVLTMDRSFSKIAASMGVGQNQSLLMKENFAKTTEEIISMGGKFEDSVKLQEDFIASTNKAVLLNSDIAESVYATTKVTGVAADQLLKGFLDVGYEADNIAENMLKTQVIANKMGVNAQAVSAMVVANLDKLNKYSFDGGVEGLAKMAGKAAMFRIDMGETFQLAEKLLSPENAIEVASALQRLGGSASQLANPLKLMDLAQNNVPELQNQLAKLTEKYTFFDEKTKSFQIMPGARRELKALEGALGVSYDSLTKMSIEGAKLKKKMSEISFTGFDFSKEQQEQVANLANLKGGVYQVEFKDSTGKTVSKTFEELKKLNAEDKKAFNEYLTKQTEEVGKDPQAQMVDLAKEQLGKADTMIASLNRLQMAIPLAIAGSKGGEDLLSKVYNQQQEKVGAYEEKFKFDNLKGNASKFTDAVGDLATAIGTGSETGIITSIENMGGAIKQFTSDATGLAWGDLKTKINDIKNIDLGALLESVGGGVADDFIWRPGEKIQKFRKDDLVVAGTNLVNQQKELPQENPAQNILQNVVASNVNKTESTVGGEITLKVMVDSTGNMSNLSLETAKMIGDRVADSMKNSPDLQEKFMSVLNNRLNNRLPIKPGGR